MKIKVLVVPTLIVVSGFLALNYIKPDFDTYMQKRAELASAEANALQAQTLAANVQSLRGEMDSQQENINFIKRYFPESKDQGRMFDSLNFLTGQSGLLTSAIQVGEVEEQEDLTMQNFGVLDPVVSPDPSQPIGADGAPGMAVTQPYVPPKVKKYSLSLEALGGYGNIKDLLNKLASVDRSQEIQSFKIAVDTTTPTEGEAPVPVGDGSTLTLTYNTILPYQATPAAVTGDAIVNIPGLSQPNFDFSAIDTLRTAITTVPDIVLGTEGKSNPFE